MRTDTTPQLLVAAGIIVLLGWVVFQMRGSGGLRSVLLGADQRLSTSKTVALVSAAVLGWILVAMLLLAPLSEPDASGLT